MGYWGWRPLISTLFICVWIIGCNIISGTAPILSPTSQPLVTLTLRKVATRAPSTTPNPPQPSTAPQSSTPDSSSAVQTYAVRPGDTLLGIALDFGLNVNDLQVANPGVDPLALQVGQQLIVPPPGVAVAVASTPIGLDLEPPTCYDMVTGSTLCLGKIANPYRQPIRQARVQVGLWDAEGGLVAEATTGIEQSGIPPGGVAPYSVILKSRPYDSASALLSSAEIAPLPPDLIVLDLIEETVAISGRHYLVTATLRNRSNSDTGPLRLVLTLFDQDGKVTGFRVVNTDQGLKAGDRRRIEIEALAQPGTESGSHNLYAEARRSS
jgi:LysM repeat protein